jgi:hypothetical protein
VPGDNDKGRLAAPHFREGAFQIVSKVNGVIETFSDEAEFSSESIANGTSESPFAPSQRLRWSWWRTYRGLIDAFRLR